MERTYRIAAVPGDGIGKETVPEGLRVLEAAASRFGFKLKTTDYDWSCERYTKLGAMMPQDGLEQLREHDAHCGADRTKPQWNSDNLPLMTAAPQLDVGARMGSCLW